MDERDIMARLPLLRMPSLRLTLDEIVSQPCRVRGTRNQMIECRDGAKLSVQASYDHYCSPRNDEGPWVTVEVGFPEPAPPESWGEYTSGDDIYGWVPVEVVREYILLHGGDVTEDPPETKEVKGTKARLVSAPELEE